MARRRGRAWGNALGGYKRQRRDGKGRFAKGGGSAKKSVAKKRTPAKKKSTAKKKSGPTRAQRREARWNKEVVVMTKTLKDPMTGKTLARTNMVRTRAEQRKVIYRTAMGGVAGTALMPGPGTAIGIIVAHDLANKRYPLKHRPMPI